MRTKKAILSDLKTLGFKLVEMKSRMNYGHIGNLVRTGDPMEKKLVHIFPKTFYVSDNNLALTNSLLRVIAEVQVAFEELKFENLKPIIETLD